MCSHIQLNPAPDSHIHFPCRHKGTLHLPYLAGSALLMSPASMAASVLLSAGLREEPALAQAARACRHHAHMQVWATTHMWEGKRGA